MFLMLPVMYFARKLDSEDVELVFKLRCAFYTVQAILFSAIVYMYKKATDYKKSEEGKKKVYVARPPEPFSDPNAKKKYMEVVIGEHVESNVTSLAGSSTFGVMIQTGLHFYKGMIAGFASQIVMGPFTLMENPSFQLFVMQKKDAFETKTSDELTTDDEIVDKDGQPVVPSKTGVVTKGKKKEDKQKKSFDEILLDTWDMGAEADTKQMMKVLHKNNINRKTKESGWTPIMIMAGLGVKDVAANLKKMKALGADPSIVDGEGWNALHWSAFHGCAESAKYILSPNGFDGFSKGLHKVNDKEGKDVLFHAEAEKNDDVHKVILGFIEPEGKDMKEKEDDNGLRKRK